MGQFAVRLENYLEYYLDSCEVTTLAEFKQLTVADRLKEALSVEARTHVAVNDKPGFLKPSEMLGWRKTTTKAEGLSPR